ncbi:hypothetical protein QBC46DRAFT_382781, partial [Diplogelasinospora grovesii]
MRMFGRILRTVRGTICESGRLSVYSTTSAPTTELFLYQDMLCQSSNTIFNLSNSWLDPGVRLSRQSFQFPIARAVFLEIAAAFTAASCVRVRHHRQIVRQFSFEIIEDDAIAVICGYVLSLVFLGLGWLLTPTDPGGYPESSSYGSLASSSDQNRKKLEALQGRVTELKSLVTKLEEKFKM